MTRNQVCNSTDFAGFKIIPIQCDAVLQTIAKLRLNILEEEQSADNETGRLKGQQTPFPLGVWRGRKSENWMGTGQGRAKYISLDWISLLHRGVGSSSIWRTDSTPRYKWFREANKEASFSKALKCVGQKEEAKRVRRVSLPFLRKVDYQGKE